MHQLLPTSFQTPQHSLVTPYNASSHMNYKHQVAGIVFIAVTHSISMCRLRRFLAVLRSFFLSSLLLTFSCHPSPPTILPSSLTSSCHYFLVYLSILLLPDSYTIPLWEFYFLPFSVHAVTIQNSQHKLHWISGGCKSEDTQMVSSVWHENDYHFVHHQLWSHWNPVRDNQESQISSCTLTNFISLVYS